MRANASRHSQAGMAVVAVMVLIAVLFLSGTVMALAVSSSLHTVDVASNQDAIHYAAESAVARAAALADLSAGCPVFGSINQQDFWANCEPELAEVAPDPVAVRSGATRHVGPARLSFQLSLPQQWKAVWTVVGWRASDPSATVRVWIDATQGCDARSSSPSVNPVYLLCQRSQGQDEGREEGQKQDQTDTLAVLHITVRGGSIELGSFVVRAALAGHNSIVTVVGRSGIEVDEADVTLPTRAVSLWNTVLP